MPDDQNRLLDEYRQTIRNAYVKTIILSIILFISILVIYIYFLNLLLPDLNTIHLFISSTLFCLTLLSISLLLQSKFLKNLFQGIQIHLNSNRQQMKNPSEALAFKNLQNHETIQYIETLQQELITHTDELNNLRFELEKKQKNWILVHEISGLVPWNWDNQNSKIKLAHNFNTNIFEDVFFDREQINQYIHPDDLADFNQKMTAHIEGRESRFEATYRMRNSNNDWEWFHNIGCVVERNLISQQPISMIGIRRNIHHEQQAQKRLKLNATVLEQAMVGIVILDEKFCYVEINPFFEKLSGLTRKHIIGQYIFNISNTTKNRQINQQQKILNKLIQSRNYEGEMNVTFTSGKSVSIRLHINAVKNEQDKITNYIAILYDISKQKSQEKRLSYLKNFDTLTDLPNRISYHEQLTDYISKNADSIEKLAILRLNIDRFRPLTKFLSQNGSDELLRQFSQRLRMRTSDAIFLAHLDNDNFALVYELSHIRPSIDAFCQRINEALKSPFIINNQEIYITLSIGIAFYPTDSTNLDSLHNYAEQALVIARNLGGNTVQYYVNQEIYKTHDYSINIELDHKLRNAIKNKEFEIYYQPKILFKTGQIQGFEALIRWKHPIKGYIAPNIFIPVAEQSSLISELGEFVIYRVAEQIKQWQDLGFQHIRIAINVAAQQLHRLNLINVLEQAVQQYSIPYHSLEIELTESSLLEKSSGVEKILNELKIRNIHISLDDFGTGYSSLSYLSNFPFDTIKIDQSFVHKIGERKSEAVITAIIAMGKAMGMDVVAEGIETVQQFDFLNKLECDTAQGYLFSKPIPDHEATIFLQQNHTKSLIPF